MTTIGEALDWRAQLRANDIQRRQGRPDRGYVDQSPPPPPPRRVIIPLEKLAEAQRVSEEDSPSETRLAPPSPPPPVSVIQTTVFPPPRPPEPPPAVIAPPPPEREPEQLVLPEQSSVAAIVRLLTPVPVAEPDEPIVFRRLGDLPVPRKAKAADARSRRSYPESLKEDIVRRVIAGKSGEQARVSRETGINQATISLWVKTHKEAHPEEAANAKPERTLLSAPTPDSLVRRSPKREAGRPALPPPGRSIETVSRELQNALERVRELKAEMRELLDD